MNIYLMTQDINNDYDTYDSVVVCAENEDEARMIHPSEFVTHYKDGKWYGTRSENAYSGAGEEYETENNSCSSWVQIDRVGEIKVKLIGTAASDVKKGVILASFNAG